MKLLVAYDGSRCSEAAIDDLSQAGLPETGAAHVLSVAEVWLPPPDALNSAETVGSSYVDEIVRTHWKKNEKILDEATVRAKHAEARVRTALPRWNVTSSATCGSPAWEILAASDEQRTDLVVVGSHGQSGLSRFFLGSISQKVLTEARCSVRIARGKNQIEPSAARILVGFDGSRGASLAIRSIAMRRWPSGTKVRVVSAVETIRPGAITSLVPPVVRMVEDVNLAEEHWMEQLADVEIVRLQKAGLEARLHIHEGNPKDILVKEAERWAADCIFVGATAHAGAMSRVLLGSTSGALAARAHCSVEVVRKRSAAKTTSNGQSANGRKEKQR